MNWDKVKQVVGQIAPALAGTLGSPAAGVAVKVLCGVFGMDAAAATPDTLAAAVQGATPEQIAAIRAADDAHAEAMAKIAMDAVGQEVGAEQAEMADARGLADKEIARGNQVTIGLAAAVRPLWGLGALALFGASVVMSLPLDPEKADIIKTVVEFYFGARLIEKVTPHVAEMLQGVAGRWRGQK